VVGVKALFAGILALVYAWAGLGLIALWVEFPPANPPALIAEIMGTAIIVLVLAAPPVMIWSQRRRRRENGS
jgi:hypothetical protein